MNLSAHCRRCNDLRLKHLEGLLEDPAQVACREPGCGCPGFLEGLPVPAGGERDYDPLVDGDEYAQAAQDRRDQEEERYG